jgi:trans-2,3-dihydro-3-hydroxyanthranilate isomerase
VTDFLRDAETGHYVLVDCFTDRALAGNQLAVFTARQAQLETEQMQRIARELNLSETVFLEPAQADGADALARIFTPAQELPFAGHPTLGAAVVHGFAARSPRVALEMRAGIVPVELDWSDPAAPTGRMTQPQPHWGPCADADAVLEALHVSSPRVVPEAYTNGPEFVIVVLDSTEELARLSPDNAALAKIGPGAYCAAEVGDGVWEVRMFAPAFGIGEDPATGSGAGLLATHLARHGLCEWGAEIEIRQGRQVGRPSRLWARASGSAEQVERVEVAGQAVIVGRGEIVL